MPLWVLIALAAPAVYVIVNYVDKYVIEHKVKDYRGVPLYGAIAGAVFGTLVWLVSGAPFIGWFNASLVLFAGFTALWGYVLYFHALSKNATSYIIALLQATPVFTLLLSVIFLHESFSIYQLIGFALVLFSAYALSVEPGDRLKINRALWMILGANLLFAVGLLIVKFTENLQGFAPILAYESWGVALGGLSLYLTSRSARRAFYESWMNVGGKVTAIMFANEVVFLISKSLTFYAVLLGPVALVSVLGNTQVFFGILYGIILTLFFPKLFSETLQHKEIVRKTALAFVLVLGVSLLVY